MRRAWMRLAGWMGVCLWLCVTAPGAHAQQTPMEVAAAQLSGPLVHSKQRKIAIYDFSGPDNRMTELGKQLADDLSVALAKSANLKVEDRSRIEEQAKQVFDASEIVADPESLLVFAHDLGAQAVVVGTISLRQDKWLSVDLKAYRVNNGKGIHGVMVSFPPNEEMAKLLSVNISDNGEPDSSKYLDAKTAGYSPPRCLSCPRAVYSPEAMQERLQGIVELIAVIGEDGRIKNVRVVKGLPAGLTLEAIKAVRQWRLHPATGPDGKPVAVRVPIQVSFQLY
jgi:TonB family protein